jgi:2-polyprenyl-6-hydroxyphenyl methylase/3-demethylubiquinone-9 3-methyltransferase
MTPRWTLPTPHPSLRAFDELPLLEQLFVRGRFLSCPMLEIARRVPAGARVADVGCGHGVLGSLLASSGGGHEVVGIDPDPRKIAWANASVSRVHAQVRFDVGTIEELAAAEPASFGTVVVCDVMYLLPVERWARFLTAARALLEPQGVLLLKETVDDGGWRTRKCLAQEQLMVRLFKRTRGSGALTLHPLETTMHALQTAGLGSVEVVDLSARYTSPHVLFAARASDSHVK